MYLKTRSFIYLKLSGNSNGANSMFIFVGVTLTYQLFRHFCINKMENHDFEDDFGQNLRPSINVFFSKYQKSHEFVNNIR
jgi:chromosome condensin MukBEF MukE localization factor